MRKQPLVVFYLLAFAFTWAYWVPKALTSRGLASLAVPDALGILAGYGPALAAILTTLAYYGKPGICNLFRRLVLWRVGFWWYAVALLLPAATTLTALALHTLLGRQFDLGHPVTSPMNLSDMPLWQQTLLLSLMFTLGFDGLGEELGWRGFALPKFLDRYSALASSLILGTLWAAWHLPYALTQGTAMSDAPLLSFLPGMFAAAILYTWIFNNTQGSILLAILFHAANNTTFHVLPVVVPAVRSIGDLGTWVQWFAVIVIVLVAGPKHLSRNARLSGEVALTSPR